MNLKKFLPFENYVIVSKLPVTEIKNRLADHIEPIKNFRLQFFNKVATKPYEGHVAGDTFTMTRIINYRNSFLPIITGQICALSSNTEIAVKMRPATFVSVFISLWLGIMGLLCLGMIVAGIFRFRQVLQNGFSPMMLIPFGMFAFGFLLTTLAFKAESKKSKEFLEQIFEVQENS